MAAYKKPLLAILISAALFAGYTYLAETGLINYVHTYFYNPATVNSFVKENQKDAEIVQSYINELQNKFADTLNEATIRSSFVYNQSAADIFERSRIYGMLLETVSGLQAVQFIDSNGIRIHYSTSSRDIVSQSRETTSYRNYNEDSRALPYDSVSVPAYENAKYTMDDTYDRIIFSYPFYDSMDVYRGTAIFTLSVRSLAEKLIAEGRLKANDDVSIIRLPPGIVSGSPDTSKTNILEKVSSAWKSDFQEHVILDSQESGIRLALISTKTNQNLFFGRLVNNSIFSIPDSMKLLLKLSMFLTFFLTLFFFLNIRPNPAVLVNNRIKTLRTNLFEQLYINKSGQEREKWILELEQRRDEIRTELKHGLKLNRNTKKTIDEIIDKAWDELLAVIKSGSGRIVYKEKPAQTAETAGIEEISEATEFDALEGIIDIGDIDSAEAAEVLEGLEEIEEISEIDDVSDIETIGEEFDESDEIEEIEDIEEIEEFAEAEEAADEIDNLIEEYEAPMPSGASKGLLKLAGEIEDFIENTEKGKEKQDTFSNASGGLLKLAIEIEKAGGMQKAKAFEDIEELEIEELKIEDIEVHDGELEELPSAEMPPSAPKKRGLLALASKEKEQLSDDEEESEEASPPVRGLLALAREIEFSQNIKPYEDTRELDAELDIVSPFQSMFSALYYDISEEDHLE